MYKPYLFCITLLFAVFCDNLWPDNLSGQTSPLYITSIAPQHNGHLIIASGGDSLVRKIASETGAVVWEWKLDRRPSALLVRSDSIWVTTDNEGGTLQLILPNHPKPVYKVIAGYGATSPVADPERQSIYLCCRFDNRVDRFDAASGRKTGSVAVLREPVSAVISDNGKYLYVANFLPSGSANSSVVAAQVSVIDLQSFKKTHDILLPNGSNALRHMLLSPDGNYLYVTHNLGRFQVPTSQLHQGWMNTSALSIIDARKSSFLGTILLDEPSRGAAGSWGIACNSEFLAVAHSGTHDVSIIDHKKMIAKFEAYQQKENLAYDLHFLYGIRRRIPLFGNGPRALCLKENELFVPTYFSDTLNRIDLKTGLVRYTALNPARQESAAQKGERIFNDASYCFQNWQSCNGCHPGEGRTDGMNWDLMNDGIGNPKNCKSLLLSHATPPNMISGIRANAELAVRAGFTHIQFMQVSDSLANYVDNYLKNLKPLASPRLVNGKLTTEAKKGKKIFEALGCAECHSGPLYTDLQMHRIGEDMEFPDGWDTPTLIEVWRTAPYLFDGRAATMEEVFSEFGHGVNRKLFKKEVTALSEYVNSL